MLGNPNKASKAARPSEDGTSGKDSEDSASETEMQQAQQSNTITVTKNQSIEDWLRRKYANNDIIKAIQTSCNKKGEPIYILRDWIAKVTDLVSEENKTDNSATLILKARYKKISNRNIAAMLGQRPFWVSECVDAQRLIQAKGSVNEEVKQYLDPKMKDATIFGVKSFLDYLKAL